MIRVGTAGWHYADWNGVVYPKPRPRLFDPLRQLSSLFDVVEVNSTFYRTPPPTTVASWVARTASNPLFRFTAKLPRTFTHDGTADPDQEERLYRAAIAPLLEAGRLGAVLVQFPQSFHATDEAWTYLQDLLDRFSDLPLVVEFRHARWGSDETAGRLRERGVGFCNIDQPRFSSTLGPTRYVTGPVAYVRFHGRNAASWFRRKDPQDDRSGQPPPRPRGDTGATSDHALGKDSTRSRDSRYDYLYSRQELRPWVDSIRDIAKEGPDTYVITNNHFRGKAAVNALEIRAALEGDRVEVPDPLLASYPELASIARTPPGRLPF